MKRWAVLLAFLLGVQPMVAQSDIEHVLASGDLVLFVPSHGYLVEGLRFVYRRFFGANFQRKWAELSAQSVASYGFDFLDARGLFSLGIQTNAPIAFVHVQDNMGYLALPVANRRSVEAYLRRSLPNTAHRFLSNYVLLSQSEAAFRALTNRLTTQSTFQSAVSKLPNAWRHGWVWFESRYLSSIARGVGVSDRVNLPPGFGLVNVIFEPRSIVLRAYTASIDARQQEFLYQLQRFENNPRFSTLSYVRGNPMLVAQARMNLSLLYRYYRSVDRLDIMGIAALLSSLKREHNVDLERDLIHNSEGRFSLVIDRFQGNRVLYFGSVGVRNRALVRNLMESLKNMVLQKREPLYAFEIFTLPFYHYKMTNGSFYFGLVENEFFFASDRDLLVQAIKDIHEERVGNEQPGFFRSPRQRAGVQAVIDVQTLLSTLSQDMGLRLARDFFVGMERIEIESYPDTGTPAYGWTTEVRMLFHR